jgi:hypothetical protein
MVNCEIPRVPSVVALPLEHAGGVLVVISAAFSVPAFSGEPTGPDVYCDAGRQDLNCAPVLIPNGAAQ